jgi:hypothetical protein
MKYDKIIYIKKEGVVKLDNKRMKHKYQVDEKVMVSEFRYHLIQKKTT